MRQVLATIGLLALLGFGAASAAQTDKTTDAKVCTLKVERMACSACAARVEKEARNIDGVKAATVSQPKGTAEITYDPAKTTPETIAKIITERTGFKADVAKDRSGKDGRGGASSISD